MFNRTVSRLRTWRPPHALLRFLPGSSRTFGPPRRMCSGWQLPSGVTPAGAPPFVTFARPQLLNGVDSHWAQPPTLLDPVRPFILRAAPARLLGSEGWIVIKPDTFVFDCAFWGQPDFSEARRWHDIFLRKKPRSLRPLTGRVLSLASDFAAFSYGHWLIDSLPRWLLLERAGLRADDFDTIYLPTPDTPSTRALLASLNLPAAKLVTTPALEDLSVESLTATSFPGSAGSACNLARELAVRLFPPRTPHRRLYLARDGHRRNFVNHAELLPIFAEFGFEICHPSRDADIVTKCGEAQIILGIEGSQCFNALFAPSGGTLAVFAPSGFQPLPYMQSIAAAAQLALCVIGARTVGEDFSCHISSAELRACLRRITSTL